MVRIDRYNWDARPPKPEDKNLFITVFTDASFCPNTKAFGCAIWIKDGAGKPHQQSWGGRNAKDPEAAETRALNGALKYLTKYCQLNGRVIVIQSDCLNALRKLKYDFLKRDFGAKFVKLKHVKAHTNHETRRTWVNNWCDENAKKEMYKVREQIHAAA